MFPLFWDYGWRKKAYHRLADSARELPKDYTHKIWSRNFQLSLEAASKGLGEQCIQVCIEHFGSPSYAPAKEVKAPLAYRTSKIDWKWSCPVAPREQTQALELESDKA